MFDGVKVAVLLLVSALAIGVPSHAASCYAPLAPSFGSLTTDDLRNGSAECRAILKELNLTCDAPQPPVEFVPRPTKSSLLLPEWTPISLYSADGEEREEAFRLLAKLVRTRALVTYIVDARSRAGRDEAELLQRLRHSRSAGAPPRFESAAIDLAGNGRPELVYRLFTGAAQSYQTGKFEPEIFLERAIAVAASGRSDAAASLEAGAKLTDHRADIVLFRNVPHLVTWGSRDTVLVYTTHLRAAYKMGGSETAAKPGITPVLRCMFGVQRGRG